MTVAYVYEGSGHEIDHDAAWDYIDNGYLLPPRTVLKGRTKFSAPVPSRGPLYIKNIISVIEQTLKNEIGCVAGKRRAVMFSGGFDSILMALLTRHCGADVIAVTVQFDNFNPRTVAGSIQLAKEMGMAHHILSVKITEFLSAFKALAQVTHEPVLDVDLAVVSAALKRYDHSVAGNIFISGMGSDQWFGNESLETGPGGLKALMDCQILDEEAHHLVAHIYGCSFVFPFLSEPMIALSQRIPAAMKQDKKLLRSLDIFCVNPHSGIKSETQVPALLRGVLVKTFGNKAWPKAISVDGNLQKIDDRVLRQIVLGLWLEKHKNK